MYYYKTGHEKNGRLKAQIHVVDQPAFSKKKESLFSEPFPILLTERL